jgi:HEAT repeat protein
MSRCCFLVVLLSTTFIASRAATAQEFAGSLQAQFDKAAELAKTEPGNNAATEELKSLVASHLANEALYKQSLLRIVEWYRQADRDEDGLRYIFDLYLKAEKSGRQGLLEEILKQYQIRRPELIWKVYRELNAVADELPRLKIPNGNEELQQAILQRRDKELRDAALGKLQAQLAPDRSDNVKAFALRTLSAVLTAKFDRQPFRPLVLPLLGSQNHMVRLLALNCMGGLEIEPGDLPAVAALADDPSIHVRSQLASVLAYGGNGRAPEVVAPALLKLFSDAESSVVESSLRSTWGQYATPELVKRLIELSRDPRHHCAAIYHGLSTIKQKSKPVCERLVEELDDPDWNNSSRAAWGLSFGVPDGAKSLVETGLLGALPEETNPSTRKAEFRALAGVASEASRDYLQSVVDSTSETDEAKAAASEILKGLQKP